MEKYLGLQGNTCISYTTDHIKMLVDIGRLPKELGDWFFKDLEEMQKRHKEMHEFKKTHPNMPPEEFLKHFYKEGPLSPEETAKRYEDMALHSELLMCLLQNRDFCNHHPSLPAGINKTLFKNIDTSEDFGIVRAIADSLYHLEKILCDMRLSSLTTTCMRPKGSITNSIGETITLEYTFRASLLANAKKH